MLGFVVQCCKGCRLLGCSQPFRPIWRNSQNGKDPPEGIRSISTSCRTSPPRRNVSRYWYPSAATVRGRETPAGVSSENDPSAADTAGGIPSKESVAPETGSRL